MVGRKTLLCLLVASIFLMPISAVEDKAINMKENVITNEGSNIPAVPISAHCENDEHEITDGEGDTLFSYVDILWASFYENPDEPQYLYVAMKIANLRNMLGTLYTVHWYCNNVHYDVAFRNGVLIPPMIFKGWMCGYYEGREPVETWNKSYNTGSFDLEAGVITWKVLKSCIGNPQPGDVITQSLAFTAQRISKIGLIPLGNLFRSFCDATNPDESEDYVIQY